MNTYFRYNVTFPNQKILKSTSKETSSCKKSQFSKIINLINESIIQIVTVVFRIALQCENHELLRLFIDTIT